MTSIKSRGKKGELTTDKRQVKLMLPLVVYQELSQEAGRQGLSLATYLRTLIYQNRLPRLQKNAKINQGSDSASTRPTLQRVRDVFV